MTAHSTRRVLVRCWLGVPAASGPIGGGLIKLGHGSNWAAVGVGVAPYAICALLYSVFVITYLAAVLRFLVTGPAGQQSMERLITISANAIVSVLTLTCRVPDPAAGPIPAGHRAASRSRTAAPSRKSRGHARPPVPQPRIPRR